MVGFLNIGTKSYEINKIGISLRSRKRRKANMTSESESGLQMILNKTMIDLRYCNETTVTSDFVTGKEYSFQNNNGLLTRNRVIFEYRIDPEAVLINKKKFCSILAA